MTTLELLQKTRAAMGSIAAAGAEKKNALLLAMADSLEAHCAEIGVRPAEAALAWLLANPLVTAPIIGPRTAEQLRMSLKALDVKLTKETLKRFDEIWPGPGGEAPEAYAW